MTKTTREIIAACFLLFGIFIVVVGAFSIDWGVGLIALGIAVCFCAVAWGEA